jgi:uncharacterized repeat protein (TIGR01451 family)
VTAGTDLTYTLVATNNGPSTAQNVSLSDTLPTGTTFVSLTSPGGFSCTTPSAGATGTVTCTASSLAAGASATFTLVVRVGAAVADGTVISNTATVSSTTTDPTPGNNSATATTTVATSADLSITKDDGVTSVTAGAATVHTFTISVANAGPSAATNVRLFDTWPAGYTLGAITPPQGVLCQVSTSPPPTVIECSLGTIAPGAGANLTIDYTVPASTPAGPQTNEAVVLSSGVTDPNGTNNTAIDTNTVATEADLAIVKTVSPTETVSGGTVTYTLVVSNTGPSDAQTVTLSDTFPATLQNVAVTTPGPAPYSCGVAGNTLTCTIGSHPVGVDATITVTASVVPGSYADLTPVSNTASVSSATSDPDQTDNSSTATFRIRGNAAIKVTKTATPSSLPEPGGLVTFKVLIENTSPASSVTITSLTDSVYGNLVGKGDCAVPQTIAIGGSYSCSFSATVSGNAGFVERNVATATGSDARGNPVTAADDATVTITDVLPRIAVTKTAEPGQLEAPGGDVTYSVTIRNLVAEPLTVLAIGDDRLGDVGSAANALVTDNSCAKAVGFTIAVGATARCEFTARLEGEAGDTHVNTVTVSVSDDDQVLQPAAARILPAAVNVVTASATATVIFVEGEAAGGEGGDQGGGQPPTDMLIATDTLSAAGPLDGPMGLTLWVLLTSSVIVCGAWVLRRQRFETP